MSTEIQSRVGTGSAFLSGGCRVSTGLRVVKGDYEMYLSLNRADLMATVATECDAIVIPRADLPSVSMPGEHGRVVRIAGAMYALDITDARGTALAFLALAEYQDTHPPVDEAQVEALAEDLCAAHRTPISDAQIEACRPDARRLIALGWTKDGRP